MTPSAVDMHSVRRVLIVKMSAMGDILHALPVAAALGETFPHLELTWVVEEPFAPLLTGNPYLSRLLTLPKPRGGQSRSAALGVYLHRLRDIRAHRFDLAIDLQGLTKSAVVARASGARTRLAYHFLREAARFLVHPVPPQPESVHVVDHYLDVVRSLGADLNPVRFPFHIPDEARDSVDAMLAAEGIGQNAPFIAVNPAAGHPLKQWGAENYAALMDAVQNKMGLPVVLLTRERAVSEAVTAATRRPCVDLTCRTDLKQLAAVLRRCTAHVCGDTGSGHLAAALGRPVVSLMGPTDPERVCPYGQREGVITMKNRCGTRCGGRNCEFAAPRCLAAITVETVLSRLEKAAKQGIGLGAAK